MSGYPGRAPTDPDRAARVAASVIGILAAVGVLVASVVINDDPRPGGPVGSGGAAVGGSLDSGGATVGGTSGSGGTSTSPTGTAPVGPVLTPAQVRAGFPLPADATPLPQPNSATTRETFETHVSPAS